MFQDAKIVKINAGDEYFQQTAKRGDKDYAVSRSDLVAIKSCPHKWLFTEEKKETASMNWGNIIDRLLLGGESSIVIVPETYVATDGKSKPWNWNSNTCKAWRDEHEGQLTCDAATLGKARRAVNQIKSNPYIAPVLDRAAHQVWVSAVWVDDNGAEFPVKCLIDIVPLRIPALADLKTTQSIELRQYSRTIFNFGYHVQAALYLDLFNAAMNKEERTQFLHIAQESVEPYEVGRRYLSYDWIALGRAEYREALKLYARCIKSGVWPSYDDLENPSIANMDGWVTVNPEPWMILHSGVNIESTPDWAK